MNGTSILTALIGVLCSLTTLYSCQYVGVRNRLAMIDGIEVIKLEALDKFPNLTEIRADIRVRGSGRLLLCGLDGFGVGLEGGFEIGRVGDWVPYAVQYGPGYIFRGCDGLAPVGPSTPFSSVMPVKVESVIDLINNYDAVAAEVSSWPDEPRERLVVTSDGVEIRVSKERFIEEKP